MATERARALVLSGVAGLVATVAVLTSDPHSLSVSSAVWGWLGIPAIPNPIFFVSLMGLALALVWPCVWRLAIDGLGKHTARVRHPDHGDCGRRDHADAVRLGVAPRRPSTGLCGGPALLRDHSILWMARPPDGPDGIFGPAPVICDRSALGSCPIDVRERAAQNKKTYRIND